jgi:hypothetical protein
MQSRTFGLSVTYKSLVLLYKSCVGQMRGK